MKNLLYIGGALALYWIITRGRAVSATRFQLKNVGYKSGKVNMTIEVQNPTEASLQLNSIAGDLFANGQYVANVSSFNQVQIMPNASTPVVLSFIPSIIGIFNTIKNVILQKKKGMDFRFVGSANLNGINFPVDSNYQF